MLKEHLSSSLGEILTRLFAWVEERPEWLRPAFLGAGLVLAFIVWRGGLIVLPIVCLVLLFKNPALLVHKVLPLFLLYVPGAGFVGGLLYGIAGPVARHLGRAGKVLQFVLGTWVYCVLLIFVIMPFIDDKPRPALTSTEDWALSGGMGLLFGLVLGIQASSPSTAPNPATDRRIVVWIVAIAAVLIVAMKIAGWW